MNAIEMKSQLANNLSEIYKYYDERIFNEISLNNYYEAMQLADNYESEHLLIGYVLDKTESIRDEIEELEWEYPSEEDFEENFEDEVIMLYLISNYLNDESKFERSIVEKQAEISNLTLFNRDEFLIDNNKK